VLRRPQAARLLAVDREATGTRLLVLTRDEAAVGGGEGSALCVADPNVADRHAVVRYARGRYYIADLKSAAGTFVNGQRIRRTQRLKHGDVIRFGTSPPYRFLDPDAQKRRQWRRNLRIATALAILIAFVLADHFGKWGVVSVATISKIIALTESNPTPARHVEPTAAVGARASAQPVASSTATISLPGPEDYAHNVASLSATPVASPIVPISALPTALTNWRDRINFYRSSNGLNPIRENPQLSAGAAAHAHYLLLNFIENIRSAKPMGSDAYIETEGKPGYTTIGAAAAGNLQLAWGCSTYDVGQQIDRWIEGPFHRIAMLDPRLSEAGYGEASSEGCWVVSLRLPSAPDETRRYPRAIEFPSDSSSVALDWVGLETPDPLASCPGYERPVGLPITLQIGELVDTNLTAHSLTENGKPIESCAFDASIYKSPNGGAEKLGRLNLRDAGAVVIIPRATLVPGSRYSVSISANGQRYSWNFTIAANQSTFIPIAPFPMPTSAEAPTPELEPAPIPSARPSRTARATHRATPSALIMPESPAKIPTAVPITESTPSASELSTNWLAVLNQYRTRLNLPTVEEDPALSHGCAAHAKYLVTNYESTFAGGWNIGALMHTEDESKPGYTPEGIKAARASDVTFQPPSMFTNAERMTRAIQSWIAGPFHRASLVNPLVKQVGFGEYCGTRACVAALDWRSDLPPTSIHGKTYATPIEVPPDGATVKPSGFGGEWPSSTTPCPGYPTNASAITLQIGTNTAAILTGASLTQTTGAEAGKKVATCSYDFLTYTNPDPGTQAHGRQSLRSFGEVVMMVRDPLAGGETYRVDMTVNSKPYSWNFTALP
jgi:uncharacterized protein YkwD